MIEQLLGIIIDYNWLIIPLFIILLKIHLLNSVYQKKSQPYKDAINQLGVDFSFIGVTFWLTAIVTRNSNLLSYFNKTEFTTLSVLVSGIFFYGKLRLVTFIFKKYIKNGTSSKSSQMALVSSILLGLICVYSGYACLRS